MEIKRILAPTDLSPASDVALATAAELAHELGAQLLLLHVLPEEKLEALTRAHVPRRPVDLVFEDLETALIDQFRRAVPVEMRRGLHVRPTVAVGNPVAEILREAQLRGADTIAMATHGRTGLAHLLNGSVAEQVVRTAPCPVLTVRHQAVRAKTT